MQVTPSLQVWLEHLRSLSPIEGAVVVGAGTGAGAASSVFGEWDVPSVVLVEADESCEKKLAALAQGREGWTSVVACVGYVQDGEVDFHVASNPAESGLIPPDRLSSLWRNLQARERRKLRVTTLDDLLEASQARATNWAVIDCLPALPVLRGAAKCLDKLDVIACRVILDESRLASEGASEREVGAFLSSRGYRCVALEEERHPALGVAIYARDLHGARREMEAALDAKDRQAHQLSQANEALIQLLEDQRAQLNDLIRERDEKARLAAGLQVQVDQMAQDRDEQARRADASQHEAERLAQDRDEHAQKAATLQQQVDQMAQDRDVQAQKAVALQHQVDQVSGERDEQTRLATGLAAQVDSLSRELTEKAALAASLREQFDQAIQVHEEQAGHDEVRRQQREREFEQYLAQALGEQGEQHLQALAQQAAEWNRKLEQLAQSRGAIEAELSRLRSELEQRARSEAELRQELRESRQTAALSVRMQTLREADLQDLQLRYQASVVAQEKQHLLLTRLSERLSAASNYFHQLAVFEARSPAIAGDAARPSPAPARKVAAPARKAPAPAPARKAGKGARR